MQRETYSVKQKMLSVSNAEMQKSMITTRKAKIGPEPGDDKELVVLNRIVRFVAITEWEHVVEFEPDIRHVDTVQASISDPPF